MRAWRNGAQSHATSLSPAEAASYCRSMEHSAQATLKTPSHAARRTAPPSTPVILHVWGETADAEATAEQAAITGWSRALWELVRVERVSGSRSELDLLDPSSLAAGSEDAWAYVVYPARAA